MRRATTLDVAHVATVLGHNDVWPLITDDQETHTAEAVAYACVSNPTIYVLMPNEHTVFMLLPRNKIMYEAHTSILPEGRGNGSVEAIKECLTWMFDNTECQKIISWVPTFNVAALKHSHKCGMREEGLVKDSFIKDGKLYDQYLIGKEK